MLTLIEMNKNQSKDQIHINHEAKLNHTTFISNFLVIIIFGKKMFLLFYKNS